MQNTENILAVAYRPDSSFITNSLHELLLKKRLFNKNHSQDFKVCPVVWKTYKQIQWVEVCYLEEIQQPHSTTYDEGDFESIGHILLRTVRRQASNVRSYIKRW